MNMGWDTLIAIIVILCVFGIGAGAMWLIERYSTDQGEVNDPS